MIKNNKTIIVVVFILLFTISIAFLAPSIRSHIIMSLASWKESFHVLGKDKGLTIEFTDPGSAKENGLNWYSRMLLFNTGDIPLSSIYLNGRGILDMSIYYTFGDFEQGRSSIYHPNSPYNSSFYGAYIIKIEPDQQSNEGIDLAELAEAVTRYDYLELILVQLGLDNEEAYFEPEAIMINEGINKFGIDDWLKIDSRVNTRSVAHTQYGFKQHYLQFGKPHTAEMDDDFPPITLFGRTYCKYIEDKDFYVVFYIQAASEDLVDSTDKYLLSQCKVLIID